MKERGRKFAKRDCKRNRDDIAPMGDRGECVYILLGSKKHSTRKKFEIRGCVYRDLYCDVIFSCDFRRCLIGQLSSAVDGYRPENQTKRDR